LLVRLRECKQLRLDRQRNKSLCDLEQIR
jgi:hypothetical protein